MIRRLISGLFCLSVFTAPILTSGKALAGPNHEAAMAIVEGGQAISDTGNLDAAMAEYYRVEAEFPDEAEAIGWARFRIAECLMAGGRFPEAAVALTPVWSRIRSGEIESPDERFWWGHRYAQCLSYGGDTWALAEVAGDTFRVYEEMETPGPGMDQAAGWLRLWSARCFLEKEQYEWAKEAAEAAWEAGKAAKNGTLAAWARLHMADAELGLGNVLGAQSILLECGNNYGAYEGQTYRTELDTTDAVCRLELGLSEDVGEALVEMLQNDGLDRGGVLGTVHRHASEALARGATDEAIGPLAVAWTCHPDFPGWGRHLGILWDQKVRGSTPNDEFIAELAQHTGSGPLLQRAAVLIQMAEVMSEMERSDEARTALAEARSLSSDPRLEMALRVAEMHCDYPVNKFTEVSAYDEIIAEGNVDQPRAEYIAEKVRPYYWGNKGGFTYGDWLDAYRPLLSDDFYRLQKAWWLQEQQKDYDGALGLLESMLKGASPRGWEAYAAKIACFYRADREAEAEAVIGEFGEYVTDPEQREHGYMVAADRLTYFRPRAALALAERGLATRHDPTWTNDLLLLRGVILRQLGRLEDAVAAFEELVSLPPDGIVGEGMMFLAGMHWKQLDDPNAGRALYNEVISRRDIMPHIQAETYRNLAELEESQGNLSTAIAVSQQGLDQCLRSDWRARGWLRLTRGRLRLRAGDPEGRAELEDLARNSSTRSIRERASHYLETGGVR